MKYLKLYENFINESKIESKYPNWFYLVLRDSRNSNNSKLTWESLSRIEFDGLRGISDNILISRAWFDIRPVMLVMPANKVIQFNNIDKIQYFNPDQLVENNFEKLIRIYGNEKGDEEHNLTSTIIKLLQSISSISMNNVIGSKKRSRIYGTWHRDITHVPTRDLMRVLNVPTFYYDFSKYVYNEIKSNNITINNIEDISNLIGKYIEENREELSKTEYNKPGRLSDLVSYYDKYGSRQFDKILNWATGVTGKIYNRREGEWIIEKGTNFIVPDGSYLFIKETPSNINDEVGYREWEEDVYKHTERMNELPGYTPDEIKEVVSDYNLDKMYSIQTVKHSYEMLDILKNKFNN